MTGYRMSVLNKPKKHSTAALVVYSDSPASDSEGAQSSPVKNKHSEDDPAEAEGHEVKRLKFDKEGEARDAPNQSASSEVSLGMGEESETSSTPQDKEKDSTCARQHCTEEDEEGNSDFSLSLLCAFSTKLGFPFSSFPEDCISRRQVRKCGGARKSDFFKTCLYPLRH